jgi:Holliday junction resolvasome RuvABC DNA-binding subunit
MSQFEVIKTAAETREIKCYGFTLERMREIFEESLTFRLYGPGMMAMSLMSDAQEEIALGLSEKARQTLNQAKWVVHTYLSQKQSGI